MKPVPPDVAALLRRKAREYNRPDFLEQDPVSIPHLFERKEDREISGFFSALLACGNRKAILASARRLMECMDHAPAQFVMQHSPSDLRPLRRFVHRTFNGADCIAVVGALQRIYGRPGGMEALFTGGFRDSADPANAIHRFRQALFSAPHPHRTEKHVGDPMRNSTAKRLCMFLRWMVRRDGRGVDFGLWQGIHPRQLAIPLDVHTARMARLLGLLDRKSNDWKATMLLTERLRTLDPEDPVRFDFALFGLGVSERFA